MTIHIRFRHWTRLLAVLVLLAFITACSSLNRQDKGPVAVTKSPHDQRNYRALNLANGMQVLLISDPAVDRAAAAVNVGIGSNSDPAEFHGLSHFLEHMLFLGTTKYPASGEYQAFIAAHGGSLNAFTSYDNTNFYFEIDGNYLEQALDRFSQFFIAPLFSEDYVNRERNAVNSEYQNGLQDDGRRGQSVMRAVINPKHPMAGFSVGSLATLQDHGQLKLRDALLSHYDRYYSANLMSVAIFGHENLDQLETLARTYFGAVLNKHRKPPSSHQPLFEPGVLPLQVDVATLRDTRALSYSFPIPDLNSYYRQRPVDYLANVLGHEGEGSLLKALRDLGWANALSAGGSFNAQDVNIFSINIALTEEGLTKVDEITALLFQYITLVEKTGIKRWLYQELATMAELSFQYQESASPVWLVTSLSERMQHYPKQDLITAAYFYSDFDASLIKKVLSYLRPDNFLMMLSARDLPVTKTDEWYNARFSEIPISAKRREQWRQFPQNTALAVSAPNPFIPENLALKPRQSRPLAPNAANVREKPRLLVEAEGVRLWIKQDNQFFTPRSNFFISGLSPEFENSLRNSLLANFVVNLVNDQLSAYAYPANLAGAAFGIIAQSRGFTLGVNGYSDKQAQLLEALLQTLTKADFQQDRFDIIKTEMIRNWQNTTLQSPYVRLTNEVQSLLRKPFWSTSESIAEAQKISLSEVKAFVPQVLNSLHLEMLYHGNITEEDALAMLTLVKRYLKPNPQSPLPGYGSVVDLPEQTRIVAEMTIPHDDSAIVIYQQAKDTDLKSRATINFLATLLNTPFFDSLRTQQQLGYVVSVGTLPMLTVNGLIFTIESPVADPLTLETRINSFLQGYINVLATMPPQQFNGIKAGLLNELRQIPEQLDALSARYWGDILLGEYSQDSGLQMADAVAALSQAELLEYFKTNVANSTATRIVARTAGRGHQQSFTKNRKEAAATVVIEAGDSSYSDFKAGKPVFTYP